MGMLSGRLAKVADKKTMPLVLLTTCCKNSPVLDEPLELCASSKIKILSSAMALKKFGFSGFFSGELNCE